MLIYGDLGVEVLGMDLGLGFWRGGFQLIGFGTCGEGSSGVFGVYGLYIFKHNRITLEENLRVGDPPWSYHVIHH